MHSLLLANVDTLALDANPASLLPNPNALGNNMHVQKLTLAWFMALMAEVRLGQACRASDSGAVRVELWW